MSKDIKQDIADQVRNMRTVRRMTQKELSARCGIRQSTISRIEHCEGAGIEVLGKIAEGLDCKIELRDINNNK